MDPRFFEQPILNSPYEYPSRHWELDASGQPTNTILREHREGRVHLGDPGGEEAPRGSARDGLRRGRAGARERGAAVRPNRLDRRRPPARGSLARASRSGLLAGDARDRAPPEALAHSSVRRHPAVLLSGRGGGDRDLADRGRPATRQGGPQVSRSDRGCQRGGQSGPRAARAQARHRRREDRDGHDHRLADHQRGAPAGQPAVHARLPGGDPRRDDPRPAARAPAQRSGQRGRCSPGRRATSR